MVLLAPEPLTLTSKWDPQWQVTRVSGTTVFLRHQQSGQQKRVHRSKVRLVNPEMGWDEVAPRPRRKQQRKGDREVTVNIHVDPLIRNHEPLNLEPPSREVPCSPPSPLPSTSAENMEIESESNRDEHPHALDDSKPTPSFSPEVHSGLTRGRPIRARLQVARESERGLKRSHSPAEASVPRCNTRWSSLSDGVKRQ